MIRSLSHYLNNPKYRSVGLVFGMVGIIFSLWVTRLPEIKLKLNLSDGELGLALFFIPAGAIIAMLASHRLNRQFGEGRLMNTSILLLGISSIFPVGSETFILLSATLFILGFFMGLTDISMNAVASIFEKKDKVNIMSTTHGFFSLGGIIGAPLGSLCLVWNIPSIWQMSVASMVLGILVIFIIVPYTWEIKDEHVSQEEPLLALPRGPFIGLAFIGLCIMIGEGSVSDWSTVFITQNVGADEFFTGFGYAAFSITMTLGRFNGDTLIQRFGKRKVVITGCLLAILGILFVITTNLWLTIIGFAIMGTGFFAVVPVLFSTAGNIQHSSSAYGIASVASAGYLGFLLGPVLIGFIAEASNLTSSFLMVGLLVFIAMFIAYRVLP